MSYCAKSHPTFHRKNPYPSCAFFFFFSSKTADISSQRCFAYKPRWYHKKKKNSPESNRTDKLRPLGNSCLYFFIFLFFFFFKFCPRYLLSCYFLQPLMFIPPDFSSSCVLYSSMSTCVNKRQKVLETVGDHPHVSSLPCIALVLCGVQARSEPHTTNCYVPVVMLCPGRCVQKPSESSGKEREVENKKKLSRVCLVI